jgi:hypothetical protein
MTKREHLERTALVAGMVLVTDHVHGAHYSIEDVGPYWEVRRLDGPTSQGLHPVISEHPSLDDALDSL